MNLKNGLMIGPAKNPVLKQAVIKVARPRGLEPLTPRSEVWCSIQLSYGRALLLRSFTYNGKLLHDKMNWIC